MKRKSCFISDFIISSPNLTLKDEDTLIKATGRKMRSGNTEWLNLECIQKTKKY